MTNFRRDIKLATKHMHEKVEAQYPFSQLLVADSSNQSIVKDYLICLFNVFGDFLKQHAEGNNFYQQCLSGLLSGQERSAEYCDSDWSLDAMQALAYQYMFIGSRMGVSQLLMVNPELRRTVGNDFLQVEFPSQLWDATLIKINSLVTAENKVNFIEKVNHLFERLCTEGAARVSGA